MTLSVLVAVAGAYLALIAFLYVKQRSLMYHPGAGPLPLAEDTQLPEARTLRLTTSDGLVLSSWFVEPQGAAPLVLYFHGNAGTLADRDFKARLFVDGGYGVLLTGYRGYGGNPGLPSEEGFYADARAALAFLESVGIGPERIVLYGESLGTGVATQMAFEAAQTGKPVRALVLETPFTAMGRAAQDHYPYVPASWLVRDKYASLDKIAKIDTPLLLMHGDADRVVLEKHGRKLFAAASEPKQGFWVPGGGHSDLYDFGAGDAVLAFLSDVTK